MLLTDDALRNYRDAGRIASKVRELARDLVHEGMPVLELCEKVESAIAGFGGRPAFPCNVGINDVAAHYTSPPLDISVVPKGSVVKVDLGVHKEGYIADTAVTVSLNPEYDPMVDAVERALDNLCGAISAGVSASNLGGIAMRTLAERGFKPVWNLHGHKMARYLVHAGKQIPNVPSLDGTKLKAGEIYAVEPFATVRDGAGEVAETSQSLIYRYLRGDLPQGEVEALSALVDRLKAKFRTLPFAERWVADLLPTSNIKGALSKLTSLGILRAYPILVEKGGMVVAQAEHTVIVEEKGRIITTL